MKFKRSGCSPFTYRESETLISVDMHVYILILRARRTNLQRGKNGFCKNMEHWQSVPDLEVLEECCLVLPYFLPWIFKHLTQSVRKEKQNIFFLSEELFDSPSRCDNIHCKHFWRKNDFRQQNALGLGRNQNSSTELLSPTDTSQCVLLPQLCGVTQQSGQCERRNSTRKRETPNTQSSPLENNLNFGSSAVSTSYHQDLEVCFQMPEILLMSIHVI